MELGAVEHLTRSLELAEGDGLSAITLLLSRLVSMAPGTAARQLQAAGGLEPPMLARCVILLLETMQDPSEHRR